MSNDENKDPERHIIDGTAYTRVSKLLEPIKRVYGSEARSEIGTHLHDAIEVFLKTGIKNCEQDAMPYFEQFLKWWDKVKSRYEVLESEKIIGHPFLGFAGKPDFILRHTDGSERRIIVDIKSTDVINWALLIPQLNGYRKIKIDLEKLDYGISVLHVSPTFCKFKPVPINENIVWCLLGINQFIKECEKYGKNNKV